MIFKTKQLTVEAIVLSPDNIDWVEKWCSGSIKGIGLAVEHRIINIWSKSLDRELRAEMGDIILKGPDGEFYVTKRFLFEQFFEPLDIVHLSSIEIDKCASALEGVF